MQKIWNGVRHRAGLIVALLLTGLAVVALKEISQSFDPAQIIHSIHQMDSHVVFLGLLCTAASYAVLTAYDFIALRHLGVRMAYRHIAFAGFTGYAVSNSLGLAMVTGGSIRYRLYRAVGVSPAVIAQIIVYSGMTISVGLATVGSLGLLLSPETVAPLLHVSVWTVEEIAAVLAVVLGVVAVLVAVSPGRIRLGKMTITLPSVRLLVSQVIVSSFDIFFCGMVLYVLLPDHHALPYLGFLAIFSAAIVVGILSHVPGGLGPFEAILLAGLSQYMPAEGVAGALIVYRLLYNILPLALAALALGLREAFRFAWMRLMRRHMLRHVAPFVPAGVATFVFVGGVVLLLSGATPADHDRLLMLADIMPDTAINISHLIASLIGLGLMILSYGLYQRLNAAQAITVLLALSGIVASLTKGLDYEEAILLALLAWVLVICRRAFYRKARLFDLQPDLGFLLAVGMAIAGSVFMMFFAFRHVEYADKLWWQFEWASDAPRSLRAAFAVSIAAFAYGFLALMRPAPRRMTSPLPEDMAKAETVVVQGQRADGNLALMGDKMFLFSPTGRAFIMYGVIRNSWIAMGDPVGDEAEFPDLIWVFRNQADRYGARPAFYEVSAAFLPYYLDVGLSPIKMGEEAVVDLDTFSTEGPERRDLRYALRRAEKDGLSFDIIPREQVPAVMADLKNVSDAWLAQKGRREKGFSLGAFHPDYIQRFDVAVVRLNGKIIAFANIWKAAPCSDMSIDLMRFVPNASPFAMSYMLTKVILFCKDQGAKTFNLGMAPLSGLLFRRHAPLWNRLGALIYTHAERFYGFKGLRHFKERFAPRWYPRYLVSPAGLAPAQVLSDVAVLIGKPR